MKARMVGGAAWLAFAMMAASCSGNQTGGAGDKVTPPKPKAAVPLFVILDATSPTAALPTGTQRAEGAAGSPPTVFTGSPDAINALPKPWFVVAHIGGPTARAKLQNEAQLVQRLALPDAKVDVFVLLTAAAAQQGEAVIREQFAKIGFTPATVAKDVITGRVTASGLPKLLGLRAVKSVQVPGRVRIRKAMTP